MMRSSATNNRPLQNADAHSGSACTADDTHSSASTTESAANGPADHGLTHSETEPRPTHAAGVRPLYVQAGAGGVLIRWDATNSEILLTPTTAVPTTASARWVKAARLAASESARAVQLTILSPAFRVYVDGQRLTRVGSPVLVHADQKVSFSTTNNTLYSLRPRAAVPPPPFGAGAKALPIVPVYPAIAIAKGRSEFGEGGLHGASPCRTPAPPMMALSASSTNRSDSCSTTTTTATATTTSAIATCDSVQNPWVNGQLVLPPGPDEAQGRRIASPSTALQNKQQPQVRQSATEVVATATKNGSCSSLSEVFPTPEVFVVSRAAVPTDTTKASDLVVEASADAARHTIDVVDSAVPRHRRNTVGAEKSSATSLRGGEDRADFSWGVVTTVASPDWVALAVLCNEGSPDSKDAAGTTSGSSDDSGSVFAAAMQARRAAHMHKATVSSQKAPKHELTGNDKSQKSKSTIEKATRSAYSDSGSASPAMWSGDSSWVDCTRASAHPRTSVAAPSVRSASSSSLSSRNWLSRLDWGSVNSQSSSAVRLKEKLRLPQRVTCVPFVVEQFGGTHRYRLLTRNVSNQNFRNAENADDAATQASYDSLVSSVNPRYKDAPWRFPTAADELVTPRTEAVVQKTLRIFPDRTQAAQDASFLHDALRRAYDAEKDQFTYTESPDLPDLLYTTFMSVSAEVLEGLRAGHPVRRLSTPLLCAGDLFGSFKDLLMVLGSVAHFTHWSMMHMPLVLLGNYVDIGWHSVEVAMLLCCWACLQPSKVTLLRGPHEDPLVNGDYAALKKRCLRYKCRQRFGSRKGLSLWRRLNEIFAVLPLAAVVDGAVFLVHGGVPELRPSPDELEKSWPNGVGGGDGRCARLRRHGALYSNTSGVPTPTSSHTPLTTTPSASKTPSPDRPPNPAHSAEVAKVPSALWTVENVHLSWRPPSAQQIFPSVENSFVLAVQPHTSDLQHIAQRVRDAVHLSDDESGTVLYHLGSGTSLCSAPSSSTGERAGDEEKRLATAEKMRAPFFTAASSIDSVTNNDFHLRDDGSLCDRSLPASASSLKPQKHCEITEPPPLATERSFAFHCDVAAPACRGRHVHAPFANTFASRESSRASPLLSAALSCPAAAAVAPPPPLERRSYNDASSIFHSNAAAPHAVQGSAPGERRVARLPNGSETPAASQPETASTSNSEDPLMADQLNRRPHSSAVEIAIERSAALTSLSTYTATATADTDPEDSFASTFTSLHQTLDQHDAKVEGPRCGNAPSSSQQSSSSPISDEDTPTEADMEQLLLATSMEKYSFATLQVDSSYADGKTCSGMLQTDDADTQRRRRLVRELLWNRPRDPHVKIGSAATEEEAVVVVDGVVRPTWWAPQSVPCCRGCPKDAADAHRCCRVFGTWGLVRFLNRFQFSLLVRGAPEDVSEMFGALLCEEGRLLSLMTCTRLGKESLQTAAACVLHRDSLQLATWGSAELADSNAQTSLNDLPGVRERRERREQFRCFMKAQVRVRMTDYQQVGPQRRWGVLSAYGEFQRQRALKARLKTQ